MTPDELRALAEALSRQRQADEHGIYCAVPRQAVDAAIKYLRAQADAQPVAWRTFDGEGNYDYRAYELNEDYADEWNRRNPNHVGWVEPLYTHPAPAAPQAEPKCGCRACLSPAELMTTFIVCPKCGNKRCPKADDHRYACTGSNAPGQTPQAEPKRELTADERDMMDSALRSSVKVVARGVAEPKREPLSDEPTGAVYGIIDPDYGRVYTIARKLAWEEGYAIGLHGSFTRDLDLIAVPWAERACEAEHLIRRIVDATGLKLRDGVVVKPHGRRAWTLLFPAFGDPRFVDLSVMPRIGGSDERIELPGYLRLQIAGTAAAHDVLAERRRQIEAEGWTTEHDDEHDGGALALAAAAYALDAGDKCSPYSQGDGGGEAPEFWPWTHGSGRHREARWWKPGTPRRNLVKAGALILAEIERLDRMGGSDAE